MTDTSPSSQAETEARIEAQLVQLRDVLEKLRAPASGAGQEAANLLALQARQQLSATAKSLASQAAHAVLRLF